MKFSDTEISRRRLLQAGASGAAVLGAAELLSACGGSSGGSTSGGSGGSTPRVGSQSAGGGKPVLGGTFNVGMISGGPVETLAPALLSANSDTFRGFQLYDLLFALSEDLKLEGRLALSAEPNKDSSEWTLKLRDGVVWHDGKPFTADDVVHSFREWSKPTNFGHALLAGLVDFKGVKRTGPLEVQVPLAQPMGDFPSLVATYNNFVVQDGSTVASFKTHPIGTGPFKYVSFTPSKQSVFVANENYWEEGKPYVDEMIVDSSFTDDNARVNALLSGKINVMPLMPFSLTGSVTSSGQAKVLAGSGLGTYQMAMRVDIPPFDDVKVRQALSLATDRQGLIDGALVGLGEIGNNLFGGSPDHQLPYYATQLKAEYDPEKAKALLKSAGKEGFSFEMPLAEGNPGFTDAATLWAQQLKAAGVDVTLQNIPVSQYWAVIPGGYLSRPIQVSAAYPTASLSAWYRAFLTTGSPIGETHWGSPTHDKEINEALKLSGTSGAAEVWLKVQEKQFGEGGELVWGYPNWVDGVANNVFGLKEAPNLFLNNNRMLDGWIGE